MPTSPLAIVRSAYDAYARRDLQFVFNLLHPDIEIMQSELLPWGGTYRGHAGAQAFFQALGEHIQATPKAIAFVPAGPDVAVWGRLHGVARASGKPIDLAIIHVWTVRDSLVARFAAYIDTPAMLDALGT